MRVPRVSEEGDWDSTRCARAGRVLGAGRAVRAVQSGACRDPGATWPGKSGSRARAAVDGGVAETRASIPSTRKVQGPISVVILMLPRTEASFCFSSPY